MAHHCWMRLLGSPVKMLQEKVRLTGLNNADQGKKSTLYRRATAEKAVKGISGGHYHRWTGNIRSRVYTDLWGVSGKTSIVLIPATSNIFYKTSVYSIFLVRTKKCLLKCSKLAGTYIIIIQQSTENHSLCIAQGFHLCFPHFLSTEVSGLCLTM